MDRRAISVGAVAIAAPDHRPWAATTRHTLTNLENSSILRQKPIVMFL
jgi:hypothetical protein